MSNSKSIRPKCNVEMWVKLEAELKEVGLDPYEFLECSQVGLLMIHLVQNKLGVSEKSKRKIIKENYL